MDDPKAIDNLRRDLAEAWHSERLVYRPISSTNDEDVTFLHDMTSDPLTYGMVSGALHRPRRKDWAKEFATALEKDYMSVMICLRNVDTEEAGPKKEEKEKEAAAAAASSGASGGAAVPSSAATYQRIGFVRLGSAGGSSNGSMNTNRNLSLGICLAAEYQNKGYGTEALRWLVEWAFHFGNLRRIGLETTEYNMAARKVYERIGFVCDGRERETTFSGGRYWDLLHYSILKREWMASKEKQ